MTNRSDQRFLHCLESVQFAKEILIVDVQSGNDWDKLSKKMRFSVIKRIDAMVDFAAIRNIMISKASQDWVLFVDSDEVVTPQLKKQLPHLIQNQKVSAYDIRRIDYFHGRPLRFGEVGQEYKTRLAKKNNLRFHRPVHETAQVIGVVHQVKAPLAHYSHTSISEFWSKITQYSRMEAEYRLKQGLHYHWHELVVFPPLKFCLIYIFKLGFLDGTRGLIYAAMMASHSLMVRVHLYELEHP